jgi:transcriptional antiterminator RfaH
MSPSPHCWYVAQFRPNAGAIAMRNLRRQGFGVFAPFEEVTIRRSRGFSRGRKPLFPGYLFVAFDPQMSGWRAINGTLGVRRLVSFSDERPAQVPDALICGLMERCDPAGRLLPPSDLEAGESVRITAGPFSEYIATVERMTPGQRAWVLLDIMGKCTRVAVPRRDLRAMS